MKKIVTTLAIAATILTASPAAARTFGWGVTGGLNVSKFDEDGAKNNSGWFAGVTAKVTIPVLNFGVDGSLLYSTEKAEINKNNREAQFISVPVNLRYDFQFPVISKVAVPYLYVGPQFDWNVNDAKIAAGSETKTETDATTGTTTTTTTTNYFKVKDASWKVNFGIGALLFNHVQVSYAYSLPISDSWESTIKDWDENTNLSTHKVGIAYFF